MNKRVLVTAILGVIMAVFVGYVITDYHQNTGSQSAGRKGQRSRADEKG